MGFVSHLILSRKENFMYREEFYQKIIKKSKKYSKKLLTFLHKSCIIFLPLLAEALFSCDFTEKSGQGSTTAESDVDKREVRRPHQEAVK